MSGNTQQWLRDELRQLVTQQNRYSMACNAATDARVKERHERTIERLQDEILGIEEAIEALDRQDEPAASAPIAPASAAEERVTDRHQAVAASSGSSMTAVSIADDAEEMVPDTILLRRRIMGQVAKVVTSAFVVGFFVVAVSMALGGDEASAASPSASVPSAAASPAKTDNSAGGVLAAGRR